MEDQNRNDKFFAEVLARLSAIETTATKLAGPAPTKSINLALAKAQAKFEVPKKNKSVEVKTDKGAYKFKYADLAEVIRCIVPALSENEISFTQQTKHVTENKIKLITTLRHSSGEVIDTEIIFNIPAGRHQELGSALTYLKRYELGALVGVASEEDDDGNAADGNIWKDNEDGKKKGNSNSSKPKDSTPLDKPKPKDEKPPGPAPTSAKGPATRPTTSSEKAAEQKPPAAKLTEAQSKLIKTLTDATKASDGRWENEDVKAFVKAAYGHESAVDCNDDQLAEVLQLIKSTLASEAIAMAKGDS